MNIHGKTFASLLVVAAAGCSTESQSNQVVGTASSVPAASTINQASRRPWPLTSVSTMPAQIKIESATVFYCKGVRCQLLGVTEPEDPDLRNQALDFCRRWFDSIGNYIGIYNDSNPLQKENGTCIVWIRGYDTHLSCLSAELVRAGLVNVDYMSLHDYKFMVPGKSEDYQETWREQLDEAAEDHRKGIKPKVLFDWPPLKGTAITNPGDAKTSN
jgi:hypothetical protein